MHFDSDFHWLQRCHLHFFNLQRLPESPSKPFRNNKWVASMRSIHGVHKGKWVVFFFLLRPNPLYGQIKPIVAAAIVIVLDLGLDQVTHTESTFLKKIASTYSSLSRLFAVSAVTHVVKAVTLDSGIKRAKMGAQNLTQGKAVSQSQIPTQIVPANPAPWSQMSPKFDLCNHMEEIHESPQLRIMVSN